MGSEVSSRTFTRDDRQHYRSKMQRSLDALATMLAEDTFSFPRRQMGLEIELNLVDDAMRPAMANSEVLEKIDDPSYTLELGQQNLEINVPPRAWVERQSGGKLFHWTEMPRGGHFAALEQPELLVDDVRLFFRKVKELQSK